MEANSTPRPPALRVLLVEDNADDAELVLLQLRRGGYGVAARRVESAAQLQLALQEAEWDVIIADYQLPSFTALDALGVLRETGLDVPFVIVSGTLDEESAVTALRAGAHDFVTKQRLARLVPAVEREIRDAAIRREAAATAEQLRRSEARFRALIESTTDVVSVLDGSGRVLYESPAVRRMLGYEPASVMGTSAYHYIHPDDHAAAERAFERALRGERPLPIQMRARHADGTWRTVEVVGVNLLEEPAVAGVVINTRDITERVRAERQLRFQAQLLNAVGQAVVATDASGRIVYMNPCAERLYGWSLSAAVGRPVLEVTAGGVSSEEGRAILERVQQGEAWTGEFMARHRDGREFPILVTDSPILEDGEVIGIVGISTDLTERKALEAQLQQSQKLEAVGQLAGGIAHDFNNLLTAIAGHADFALTALPADVPGRDDVVSIAEVAARAGDVVRQLLAFSRRQVRRPEVLLLNDVIESTRRMLGRLIGEDITLETRLTDEATAVFMDRTQLEQILVNLVVNARDAMPQGGTIQIATDVCDPMLPLAPLNEVYREAHVRLTVTDNGSGIGTEVLPHIFEPFFTTKEKGAGTGLGLATVYGIVQQAGGEVFATSAPGFGATFTIALPLALEVVTREGPGDGALLEAVEVLPSAGQVILLVEDEPGVRGLARRALERGGYVVVDAANAEEAMRHLLSAELKIDLLLTDAIMPGLGGRALAERAVLRRPNLPVLYMSGYAEDEIVHRGILPPGVDFLEKPFTPAELCERVALVLAHPHQV